MRVPKLATTSPACCGNLTTARRISGKPLSDFTRFFDVFSGVKPQHGLISRGERGRFPQRRPSHAVCRSSEPESQTQGGDLCFQKVLVERSEALTVELALDGEVVEHVGEREEQLGTAVHDLVCGGEVE